MNVKVYNQLGKETGEMQLPKVFELPWNADLVHQVVTSQAANRRPVVAHVKHRGEVRGGGRKPWRQKGTGRARHGSIRSPLWKGGGVTHGPTKERNFKKKINRKMAAKAAAVVLARKAREHELVLLDRLELAETRTREAEKVFKNLSQVKHLTDIQGAKRALLLLAEPNSALRRAFRNLLGVEVAEARNVTALDLLNRKYIVAPRSSVEVLAKRFSV